MSMLLDTNIIIDYSRGNAGAVNFVESLSQAPKVSVLSVTEIIQGIRESERSFFQEMFDTWEVLPITYEVALLAGEYRLEYLKNHNLSLADALIASTSQIYQAPLATLNIKDFPMIEYLQRPYER